MGVADVASSASTRGILAGLISTTPADGGSFSSSEAPTELSLHLPPALAAAWTDSLVKLERVESNGSEASIQVSIPSSNVSFDMAARVVTISLAAPLTPGHYAFVLTPGFQSRFLSQGRWDPTTDQVIAEFEVESSDSPAETKDLGVLGSPIQATGILASTEGAQDVYHFHLAADQPLWQVALQVDVGSIGSGLIPDLAVYDQAGNLVKNALNGVFQPLNSPGDGTANAANNAYLVLGLAPGDYHVVVSKAAGHAGGEYRLDVAADPAKAATTVTGFSIDHSNGTATGFTLAFSAPIDPNTAWWDSVKVVDAHGQAHQLHITRADYGLQRLGFTFTSPMPAGSYTVIISGDRPLADLVGRAPIAADLPAGTLARFTLSTTEAPTTTPVPNHSKILGDGAVSLPAGGSIDVPIVVDQNALLTLNAQAHSGWMRIEVINADGAVVFDASDSSSIGLPLLLPAGAYTVRLTAVGDAPFSGSWSLIDDARHDSPVADAVGPGGVLAIRLGVDRSSSTSPTTSTTSSHDGFIAALAPAARSTEMGPSPWAAGASVTSTLVGRPGANGDGVPSVGPSVPGGVTAVAWAAPGSGSSDSTLGAILAGSLPADDGADRGPAGEAEPPGTRPAHDDEIARTGARTEIVAPDADDAALLQADRVLAALQGGFQWLFDGLGEAAGPSTAAEPLTATRPEDVAPSNGQVEQSSLDLPVGVLFVTASTVHLRRAALRWWRKHRAIVATTSTTAGRPTASDPLFRGPRRMTPVREGEHDRVHGPRRG